MVSWANNGVLRQHLLDSDGVPTQVERADPTWLARHYRFRGQFRTAGRRRDYRKPRPAASMCARQWTGRLTQAQRQPHGAGRDHPPLTPGKIHRSGPTGQEMGEGRGCCCCCYCYCCYCYCCCCCCAVEASPGAPLRFGVVCNDSRGRQAGLGLPELAWLVARASGRTLPRCV